MQRMNKDILILVKTYPNLSTKYHEIVCTAGIDKEGNWYRIYPIPFNMLNNESKYKKYQWINCDIWKNTEDARVESHKIDYDNIKVGHVVTDWADRLKFIETASQYDNLEELIAKNKQSELSLAVFKPSSILDVKVEPVAREYDNNKVALIEDKSRQNDFFKDTSLLNIQNIMPKLPYRFSYKFTDVKGKESTLMIEDWEIGQLYLNCLKNSNNNEKTACEQVKAKYLKLAKERNVVFFLGTTKEWDKRGTNPFLITGVFYPPQQLNDTFNFN